MSDQTPVQTLLTSALSNTFSRRVVLRRAVALGVAAPVIGPLLAACGGGESTPVPSGDGSTATQAPAGSSTATATAAATGTATQQAGVGAQTDSGGKPTPGGTLTIVRATDPQNLHPGMNSQLHDIATNFLLYDALVISGFDGAIQPALAEKWENSEDGKSWTFTLRQDVKFHSGEPFNSAHVVDHFQRWKKMPTANKIVLLESIEAPDDHTVICHLSSTTLVFLNMISQTEWAYGSIPNMKKVAELGDDYGVKAVDGTGPFKLTEWVKDDHMTLTRNDDYTWGSPIYDNKGPAYPDQIIFKVSPEASSRTNLTETGEVDLNIDVAPQDVQRLSGVSGLTVKSFPRISSNHFGFNMERELFSDINVRRAILHAVKRDDIAKFVMQGMADPAEGYLHPEVPGALPRDETRPLLAYDADKAKQLLDESGWVPGSDGIRSKNGTALSFSCYVGDEFGENVCQAVQGQLREVGVEMTVKRLEAAGLTAALKAGEHDARFAPMIYTTGDHMYFWVTSSIPSPNALFWSDAEFDQMFITTQTTTDEDERLKTFGDMERRILDEVPLVPIQHQRWIFAWQDKVKNTKFHNIHGIYKLMDTWIKQ